MEEGGTLGVIRGAALYVGALIGPGLLLVPALAAQAAGGASIIAWGVLLVLSAPLAITFAALGVRHPVSGGVSAYVREGFGDDGAAVTGGWFIAAVFSGAPAVALIGGYYVSDLTGSGTVVAATVGLVMFGAVLIAHACRPSHLLRVSARSRIRADRGDGRGDLGRTSVSRERQLAPVCATRLVGSGHGGEHPRLAVRRLGGSRATRR